MDYQIQPSTRRCTVTGRELKPGERVYTVLLDEGRQFVRQDFASESWQGPPANAFSFWTGRVPTGQDHHKPRFDDDLLEECFQKLEGEAEPAKVRFRYVIALLLVRRKRLKFEQTVASGTVETMVLSCVKTGQKYQVIHPRLTEDEMKEVQTEVFRVLGWN